MLTEDQASRTGGGSTDMYHPCTGSLSPAAGTGDDDGADSITNAHVVRGS
jgi:hypothetical protein